MHNQKQLDIIYDSLVYWVHKKSTNLIRRNKIIREKIILTNVFNSKNKTDWVKKVITVNKIDNERDNLMVKILSQYGQVKIQKNNRLVGTFTLVSKLSDEQISKILHCNGYSYYLNNNH